ncbi:hypothetical protein [Flagellimonas zhangzhouensis]|nr:hypothetical protein [Allomuricauda zhangzhouensis]
MRSFFFLLTPLLMVINSSFGQNLTVSEFDLYGCWKKEPITKENGIKQWIYVTCDISETGKSVRQSDIVFKAYNKCEFLAVIQDALCPIVYQRVEGTWTYDEKSGIVEVFYPKDFQKEILDTFRESHPELEIPNPRLKTKFKILGIEDGKIKIEKTTANIDLN